MSKVNMKLAFAILMYLPTAFVFVFGAKKLGNDSRSSVIVNSLGDVGVDKPNVCWVSINR